MKHRRRIVATSVFLVLLGAFLFWLRKDDDEIRHSIDIDSYSPVTTQGVKNYQRLLELTQQDVKRPQNLSSKALRQAQHEGGEAYRVWLLANRLAIEENYRAVQTQVEILASLAEVGPIEDNTSSLKDDIIQFSYLRNLCYSLEKQLELASVDDSAQLPFEQALAVYKVLCELQTNSRVIVHQMICTVLMRRLQSGFEAVLPVLSYAQKQALLKVLEQPIDFVGAVDKSVFSEYAIAANDYEDFDLERRGGLIPFVFLRNRTLNFYGDHVAKISDLAHQQAWDEIRFTNNQIEEELLGFQVKNFGGKLYLAMAIPAMGGIYQQAYECGLERNHLRSSVAKSLTSLTN